LEEDMIWAGIAYLELIGAGMSPEPIENGKQIVAGLIT